MFKGSTGRWSGYGAALMLTIAQLNTSCCSQRKATESSRAEATTEATVTAHAESLSQGERERSQTAESQTATLTEVEIYDTEAAADPQTGRHPVKARIRQRSDRSGTIRTAETLTERTEAKADSATTHKGAELAEAEATATQAPSLWARMKQGAAWATAIIILAAAGAIIYKLKKR